MLIRALIVSLVASVALLASQNGMDSVSERECGSCHIIFTMSKEKVQHLMAPPFWAIASKVKKAYPNRLEGIEFVVEYVKHPSKEKMLFPASTIEHFGLMPAQSHLKDDQIRAIATYMLDHIN